MARSATVNAARPFFRTYVITPLLILISATFYLLHSRPFLRGKSKKHGLPPGPEPWPLLGNLPEFFLNKPVFRWIHGLMKEFDTDIACIRVGDVHIISVTSPEIGREFLKKQDALMAGRPATMAAEYCSSGFLAVTDCSWGDQWKKMRRVVTSEVVKPLRMRWLQNSMTEEANSLVLCIYNQIKSQESKPGDGAVLRIRDVVRHYSANIARKMVFGCRHFGEGRPDGGPGKEEEEHVDAVFTVLSLLYVFNISDFIPSLRCLDLDGEEKIIKRAIQVIKRYHEPIVDDRIKEWESGLRKEPGDILDGFITAKDADGKPLLTVEEIKAEAADLIYNTVDNPPNAVEWALGEMLNQPDVLQKAVEEIDRVVGRDRLVQESDIPHLNYVKSCLREAFRMHPVAPFNVPHVALADTTVAGYFIPKGSHILLSRIALGRNPKVWDNPNKFDPERHMREYPNGVELIEQNLRFITFTTGRRGCMGPSIGAPMTVMLLARLLQGFSWSIPDGKSHIDLSESWEVFSIANPVIARAKPRLPPHIYPGF